MAPSRQRDHRPVWRRTSGVAVAVGALITYGIVLNAAYSSDRGLLWWAVQACVANYKITGVSFPCLDVNLAKGTSAGYAVIRAPNEKTHIIVVPTSHVPGVESPRLQEADAPHYFADAWQARHHVQDLLRHPLGREDVALALNSLPGRSQDQLHIHVDCIEPAVRNRLRKYAADFKTDAWTKLPFDLAGERYWGLRLNRDDLDRVNIFRAVADGLHIAKADRPNVTIALAGGSFGDGEPGFYLLAATASYAERNEGHGENLLDHSCLLRGRS